MKKLLPLLTCLCLSLISYGQAVTGVKTRFPGIWYQLKDTASATSADTLCVIVQQSNKKMYYHGSVGTYWVEVTTGASGGYILASDTTAMLSPYRLWGRISNTLYPLNRDTVKANLGITISDTSYKSRLTNVLFRNGDKVFNYGNYAAVNMEHSTVGRDFDFVKGFYDGIATPGCEIGYINWRPNYDTSVYNGSHSLPAIQLVGYVGDHADSNYTTGRLKIIVRSSNGSYPGFPVAEFNEYKQLIAGGALWAKDSLRLASNQYFDSEGKFIQFGPNAATAGFIASSTNHEIAIGTKNISAIKIDSFQNIMFPVISSASTAYALYYNPTSKNVSYELAGIKISDTASMLSLHATKSETLSSKIISGSSNIFSNIGNSSLTNSTISGVSIGDNLFNLSNGYGIAGGAYNGSAAITISADSTVVVTKSTAQVISGRKFFRGAIQVEGSSPNIYLGNSSGTGVYVPVFTHYNATGNKYFSQNLDNTTGDWQLVDGTSLIARVKVSQAGLLTITEDLGMSYGKSLYFNSSSNQYITADASFLYLGAGNAFGLKIAASNQNVFNAANTTTFNTVSDVRTKTNIDSSFGALDIINKLNAVKYDNTKDFRKKMGWEREQGIGVYSFLAQEYEKVLPKFVVTTTDSVDGKLVKDFKSIDQSPLIPINTAAIKELYQLFKTEQVNKDALINNLQSQIDELKALIKHLK